jgi:hypothetical protein
MPPDAELPPKAPAPPTEASLEPEKDSPPQAKHASARLVSTRVDRRIVEVYLRRSQYDGPSRRGEACGGPGASRRHAEHIDDEQCSPPQFIADAGDVESDWDRLSIGNSVNLLSSGLWAIACRDSTKLSIKTLYEADPKLVSSEVPKVDTIKDILLR